jgi:hypothetical protein
MKTAAPGSTPGARAAAWLFVMAAILITATLLIVFIA